MALTTLLRPLISSMDSRSVSRPESPIGDGFGTFGPRDALTTARECHRPRKRSAGSRYARKGWRSPGDRRQSGRLAGSGLRSSGGAPQESDSGYCRSNLRSIPRLMPKAVHVRSNRQESVSELNLCATRHMATLHILDGPVESTLLRGLDAADVEVAVLGTRSSQEDPHLGHIAAGILRSLNKSMVFVPPDAVLPGAIRRLVAPLEGTETTSRPVRNLLKRIVPKDIELVVVHVFTDETLPAMLDRPYRDLEFLGQKFLAHHCPPATDIRLRQGPVAASINEITAEGGCDLVVLSWSQDFSPGRAQVIREVLESSVTPS